MAAKITPLLQQRMAEEETYTPQLRVRRQQRFEQVPRRSVLLTQRQQTPA
jgi:hypothetical protein